MQLANASTIARYALNVLDVIIPPSNEQAPLLRLTKDKKPPGDFAVVKKRMRFMPYLTPDQLVEELEKEVRANPGHTNPIGFQTH